MLHFCCTLVLLVGLSAKVQGHSWIACTDYDVYTDDYYSHSKCHSWPRHATQYCPKTGTFGGDTGYNYLGPSDSQPCRTQRNDGDAYTADHPMAIYYAGQTVVIAHPTKNHCADPRCTSQWIPDQGNFVYAVKTTATAMSDPSHSSWTQTQNLVADFGVAPVGNNYPSSAFTTFPKPGFQNAPKFCENMDKAVGTNNFTVPRSYTAGRYSFIWTWFFNSKGAGDEYTSCWEADVYATKAQADAAKVARGSSNNNNNGGGGSPGSGGGSGGSPPSPPPAAGTSVGCQGNARQETSVTFTQAWNGGANGAVSMPSDYAGFYVKLTFPEPVTGLSAWGAILSSLDGGKNKVYRLEQNDQYYHPASAGFTVQFGSTCATSMKASAIESLVLSRSGGSSNGGSNNGGSGGSPPAGSPPASPPPPPSPPAAVGCQGQARQDSSVSYTQVWNGGGNGAVSMPSDFAGSYVQLTFPAPIGSLSVWGATLLSLDGGKNKVYRLEQNDQYYHPASAGFTIQFGTTCTSIAAGAIEALVLSRNGGVATTTTTSRPVAVRVALPAGLPGGTACGSQATQQAAVKYTSSWQGGANGEITMPVDANRRYVQVHFPAPVSSFLVWGATVRNGPVPNQDYIVEQNDKSYRPATAGFTAGYGTACGGVMPVISIETKVLTRAVPL